ncbi:MAG: penicillin-binding protein [Eggerthellaceae bacterium]|nr:penicillin-binding protein [Eggerthellaceae bacterium]
MAIVLSVLAIFIVLIGAGGVAAYATVSSWLEDLPDYTDPEAFNTSLPTYVYAADRTTVLARFQFEYREPVTLEQINPLLIEATISVEDARYYEHGGVDYYGVMRALVNNLTGGRIEGASTITQQFVRNTILASEMEDISFKRKAREMFIATQLEKEYSKDEILNMYLNTINYGAGAHGIEAAARRYFSKSATDLTLAEAALLAGIPQSPTYNDPLLYPENALNRRNIVLDRMFDEHYITQEEHDAAIATPIELNPQETREDGIIAYPYFTSYVRSLLYNNYDLSEADILRGGLRVYTTLDVTAQNAAEAACQAKRDSMYSDRMEVAMAVVDPHTGYVKAIVGGSNYDESQVNIATGQGGAGRPCGSVFKTFTMVTAIRQGINPNTTHLDCSSPATVDGYTLENYDNTNFGDRTIAGAFAVSSNTGFVRLISSIGVKQTAQTAHDLGVTIDLEEDIAGSTLTLGVQNVTPLELANCMATLANGGVRHDLCAITTIEDHDGNVIVDDTDREAHATRVISNEEAYAAQRVMMGVVQGGTGTDAAMWNGQQVAGKTGTSEDYKDISFVGYTPNIAAAIWVGDPTNETSVPAGSCGDVFKWYATDIMEAEGIPVEDFPWYNDPAYTPYDDSQHQVMSEETYQAKKAEEERKKKEEEEKKKKEEEEKKKAEEAAKKAAEEAAAKKAAEEAAAAGSSSAAAAA